MSEHYDYTSPGLVLPDVAPFFPDRIEGDPALVPWEHMRKDDPHRWYCDRTMPTAGFINVDETAILYNTALQFRGRPALEIGCLFGWSTWHMAAAGCKLMVADPLLAKWEIIKKVSASVRDDFQWTPRASPDALHYLRSMSPWNFIFIDANHDAPHPVLDAVAAAHYAADDALILFHDVICPDVFEAVRFLRWQEWHTRIYNTSQVMAACWRGDVRPVDHVPDRAIEALILPNHLALEKFNIHFGMEWEV